ncbi:hypothetical protein CLV51_102849 [Chitinophaga niastensis]|uniref:Uncharacterized protein n=1 Tax=Chitinophaga niastensis TaxID=536980 RepID=A0A2P8HP39_CHINA|nr:hypothetical protein [Chitinophaga niastensis]PSL47989.1 hypothetical protein CLV51_102849 [Chitinophaga niastensis]
MAQIKITNSGINDIRLGMNIQDASNIIPFSSFKDKGLFVTRPNDSSFYVLQTSDSLMQSISIPYIFISTNENKIINNIILFVNDTDNKLEQAIVNQFGHVGIRNYDSPEEPRNLDLLIWAMNEENTIVLVRTPNVDPVLNFRVTEVHIYKTKSVEYFGNYSIETRMPYHDFMIK